VTAAEPVSSPTSSSAQRRLGYAALAALAYLPVMFTAMGKVAADTKQYLYLDPNRLMTRAVSMWDSNIGLGTVTHQNIGYVFPMGPYYWVCEHLGLPDWIAQRIWLGSILFLAALGMLFLLRTLNVRGVGVPVAAVAYMLSPYSLDYAARISVILLPFAGLPWMLALTIRALRKGDWRYPALFAIVVQIIGGVNATALIFAGVAPVLWIIYATFISREVDLRRALATTARIGALTIVTSLWWIAGLSLQAGYGLDVLKYTETVKTVSTASVAPEIFRGLGYWFFYGRDKLGPWIESGVSYTQWVWLILVGYSIPTLALLSAVLVRWKHRLYFAVLAFVGLAIAVGAHPYDSPSAFGSLMKSFADKSSAGLALRSTGRAVPLVALSLAVFLALGVNVVAEWFATRRRLESRRLEVRRLLVVPGVVLVLILVNFPALWNGSFYGKNLQRPEDIPRYWKQAAAAIDAGDHQTRVLEIPGSDFASYRWGNLVDPITPGITDRPYVARELIPWGSAASSDLLNALDRRLQEGVLDPTSIAPVARLMGAGAVVARNDLQVDRYNLVRPVPMKLLLTPPPRGLRSPQTFGTSLGPPLHYPLLDEITLGLPTNVSDPAPVEIFGVRQPARIVRAQPAAPSVVMSGDGEGVVGAAAVGLISRDGIVVYSASKAKDAASLRREVADASTLVVTDSNRKRARRWSTVRDNLGYTEGPGEHLLTKDSSDARLEVFPGAGPNAMTVTEQHGAHVVASAYGNPVSYTPEDRAARALDADLQTAWKVGAFARVIGERIRLDFDSPITADHVNLVQPVVGDRNRWITRATLVFTDRGKVTKLPIVMNDASRTPAGQTVSFPARRFDRLEIVIDDDNIGPRADYIGVSAVGFAEIRLHDVHASPASGDLRIREVVRMPTDLTSSAGAASQRRRLVFLMERLRTLPVPPRYDEELQLSRAFTVPTARRFSFGGEARLSAFAADTTLDADLGYPSVAQGGVDVSASTRLPGSIASRASALIDGDPATSWATGYRDPAGKYVEIVTPAPVTFDHLDLRLVADGRHSVPTQLRLEAGGQSRTVDLPSVPDSGTPNSTTPMTVRFPALVGNKIRVTIAAVREVKTIDYYSSSPIVMPAAIAELGIPGVQRPAAITGVLPDCRNDLVFIDGKPVSVRIVGDRSTAEARGAMALGLCDPSAALALTAGRHELTTAIGRDGGVDVDRLTLASDAGGGALSLAPRGIVTGADRTAGPSNAVPVIKVDDHRTKITVHVRDASKPFTLVLGESFNSGWKATVGGHDVGPAQLVNGYANGFRIDPHGRHAFVVELTWTPQTRVWIALGVSAAGMVLCVVLAVRRSRRSRRGATEPGDRETVDAPAQLRPWPGSGTARSTAVAVVAGVGVGAVVAFFSSLLAGVVIGALLVGSFRSSRLALVLRFGAPASLAACGVYIAAQQFRFDYPPLFEWPTFFDNVHVLGWCAAGFLLADAVLEALRDREPEPDA